MEPTARLDNTLYERLLFRQAILMRVGYKLCCPFPGWGGWDSWVLYHRRTGRMRSAPDARRLEKIINRLEKRLRRRGQL